MINDEPFASLAEKSKLINIANLTGAVFAGLNILSFINKNSHTGPRDESGSAEKASLAKLYDKLNKEANSTAEEKKIEKAETFPWQVNLVLAALSPDYEGAMHNSRKLTSSESILTPVNTQIFNEALDLLKRMR